MPLGSTKSAVKNWRQERLLPNNGLVFRGVVGLTQGPQCKLPPTHPTMMVLKEKLKWEGIVFTIVPWVRCGEVRH